DAVKAGGFLTGRPADIIEQLKAVEKRYPGVDRVVCATPLGTPLEVQLEDLDRFAKEVMPAFRPAKIAAAAEEYSAGGAPANGCCVDRAVLATLDRRRSRCDRRDAHLIVVSWRRLAFNNPVPNR